MQSIDVVIVGAGPAGIGMAMELCKLEGLEFAVLERDRIGESFRRWPAQTRLITPSFYSNPFGMADLNSVDAVTSPASFAGTEHLSGEQYSQYLTFVANTAQLPIACGCKVESVEPKADGDFHLVTERGELRTRFLIWACGEYQFPNLEPFPGGELCQHYAHIEDWRVLDAEEYTVIGGYESGLDAAINLLKLGRRVRLLIRKPTWNLPDVHDPSQVLSPHTRERLRETESNERLEIVYGVDVVEVSNAEEGGFRIHAADGRHWDTSAQPVLGTGFLKGGGAQQISDLWLWNDEGHIDLTVNDESIYTPGLFLVGPQVRQQEGIYCFIYKFRQRFERVARQIALRLELDIDPPEDTARGNWGPFGNSECCEGCEC